MDEQPPAPLVPAEVDLRGMEFMPLFGDRLFKSTTWIEAEPEARVAALRLWWHAYAHEVPAASLPDNDMLLAEHAGYGVAVKAWQKVKPRAMRGWVRCSDGRWYHKVVAELALEAWQGRVRNREKIRKWREKKDAANRSVPVDVTVTGGVTEPSRNGRERQGQRERQLQRQLPQEAAASSVAARETPPPEPDLLPPPALDRSVDTAYELWLPVASDIGISEVGFLNDQRRADLQARLREVGGIEGWKIALAKLREAKFLRELDDRPKHWLNLGWVLKPENFTNLMEGRYAERHRHDKPGDLSANLAALAELGGTRPG